MNSIVGEKSENFAVRSVNLCNYLKKEKHESVISRQLLRILTGITRTTSQSINDEKRTANF